MWNFIHACLGKGHFHEKGISELGLDGFCLESHQNCYMLLLCLYSPELKSWNWVWPSRRSSVGWEATTTYAMGRSIRHCALDRWSYLLSRTPYQITATTVCWCCSHQSILKSASILHVTSFGWKCKVELCHPPPPSTLGAPERPYTVRSVCTGHHRADPPWDEGQRLCAWAERQLHGHLKQEVQINLSSWNYRGNLGRQNAISQDTEVNTVNLVESAMGPLITATGQGLSFMSHPKDGTSRWAVGLLRLEEESSATYRNTVTSPNTWAHLEDVTSSLDCLKN